MRRTPFIEIMIISTAGTRLDRAKQALIYATPLLPAPAFGPIHEISQRQHAHSLVH